MTPLQWLHFPQIQAAIKYVESSYDIALGLDVLLELLELIAQNWTEIVADFNNPPALAALILSLLEEIAALPEPPAPAAADVKASAA